MVLQEEIIITYNIRVVGGGGRGRGWGGRYENLSPEEYLDITIPYLRDLINDHKPTAELNNDSNTERGE